jgi:hypothetical protein
MLTDKDITLKYGEIGNLDNITSIKLPYPMLIAWDKSKSVTKIQCHKLVASNLISVFADLLSFYGLKKIHDLGIDIFGGCYNVRLMRGSKTKWSRHSWGIAIDLDPERNGYKVKWKNSQFSKPEYAYMVNSFYRHGFFNLGKERNFDAMHFEIIQ